MGFKPMTLCSTFWSNRLPAHSCSRNDVNVFCPPPVFQVNEAEKERNESEEEHQRTMIRFKVAEDQVQSLQKDLKRAITKSKWVPFLVKLAETTLTHWQTDRQTVGGTEQGHWRSKTRSSTIRSGHHADGWLLHARLCTWPQGFSRVKFCADSAKPFGWGIYRGPLCVNAVKRSHLLERSCGPCQSLADNVNSKITQHARKMLKSPKCWS